MSFTVRRAEPADVDAIVPLMHESSRDLVDYTLGFGGRDPQRLLRRDFVRGRGLFGVDHQIVVADDAGRVVATLTVYPGARAAALTLASALTVLMTFGPLGFLRFVARSLAIAKRFAPPERDALFLANGCVDRTVRDRGLFSMLMAEAQRIAQREGLRAIELDVSFANESARRKYEHLGFRVVGERAPDDGRAVDGFRRMRRPAIA